MNAKEKEQVILAVEKLGRAVSVAEVAKTTGLNSNIVFHILREIAAATGGNLQVVQDGEICFGFTANFAELYEAQDRTIWLAEAMRGAMDMAFFIARIVFGITLLITIYLFHPEGAIPTFLYMLLIFTGVLFELHHDNKSIIAIAKKGIQSQAMKRSLGFGNLSRLFSYKYRENKLDLKESLRALLKEEAPPNTQGTSLFNICFSFVFGDGNPNIHFDELKWQVVAEVIRQHNGAVITDQLAPYLCCAPDDEESMLPVLQRFNGIPRATESGNLVYLFPELMKAEKANFKLPSFLKEKTWRFSDLPFPQILPVWLISTLLLFLGYYEYLHPDVAASFWFEFLPAGFHTWQFVFPFAFFFSIVPSLRFLFITLNNTEIEERNNLRKYFAEILHKPDDPLFQKLLERNECQLEEMLIQSQPENVLYTTQKTLNEQILDG